jgi:hypothetical protein
MVIISEWPADAIKSLRQLLYLFVGASVNKPPFTETRNHDVYLVTKCTTWSGGTRN